MGSAAVVPSVGAVFFPLFVVGDPSSRVASLKEEVEWRNRKDSVAGSVLDSLVKQLRIFRGVALCSLALAVIALLRAVFVRRPVKNSERIPVWQSGERTERTERPLVVALCSTILYLACMWAWGNTEWQYHLLVAVGDASSVGVGSTDKCCCVQTEGGSGKR
jgi:hypothetical protein